MIEATSCGGVVIFRGKILLLYKNFKNKYEGWVLPKGTVEEGEEYKDTALREVKEESGATASIIKYIFPVLLLDSCMDFCGDQPTRPERSMPSVKCFCTATYTPISGRATIKQAAERMESLSNLMSEPMVWPTIPCTVLFRAVEVPVRAMDKG